MKAIAKAAHLLIIAAALALSACSESTTAAGGDAAAKATTALPLKPGFYVSRDTACAAASNASLLLVRHGGFNGAHDSCDFKSIEQIGPRRYRVTARCAGSSKAIDGETLVVDWELLDDASFKETSNVAAERRFRHCEQSNLPDPWRHNDISDLIGKPAGQ